MKIKKCLLAFVLLGVTLVTRPLFAEDWLPDPNLRLAVRAALREKMDLPDNTPLRKEHLRLLTRLSVPEGSEVKDLTGLEYAVFLQQFNADRNHIEGLQPLASLVNLTSLSLHNNRISDITPLLNLTKLENLYLSANRILDISPLEKLINLRVLHLHFGENQISNLLPLSDLVALEQLALSANRISDISPLERLTNLKVLHLDRNQISDITPLRNLTELVELNLNDNKIVDISALENLSNLVELRLKGNPIGDVSPLLSLSVLKYLNIEGILVEDITPLRDLNLIDFRYDVLCSSIELPTRSVGDRLLTRAFPSVFQAGSPMWIEGVPLLDRFKDPELVPFHDLLIGGSIQYGNRLHFEKSTLGAYIILDEGVPQERHMYYHGRNPDFVSLYWWEFILQKPGDLFSDESKYWMTDRRGNRVNLGNQSYLNIIDPEVQEILIKQGVAMAACGLFDGFMIDNFGGGPGRIVSIDNREERLEASEEEIEAAIIHIFSEIRAQVSEDFIIIVNAGVSKMESLSELINGAFMEFVRVPGRYYNYEDLSKLENTLRWNETNLRYPQVNGVDGFGLETEHPNSPNNQKWMRVFTTLTLTHSDGYVLYNAGFFYTGDDSKSGHEHAWYDFWDAPLGHPVGGNETKAQLYDNREGLFIREFTNGWAVYNRSGKKQQVGFSEAVSGVASSVKNKRSHTLPDLDGEIYLKTFPQVAPGEYPPLYWINAKNSTLQRLSADKVENLKVGVQKTTRLAVDAAGGKLYWTEQTSNRTGKIQSANLEGRNVQIVRELTSAPLDIALDIANGKLYLSNAWGKIQRMNLDGSNFQPNLITGLKVPRNLVLDTTSGQLYWTEQTSESTGKVQRANLDGSTVQLVKGLASAPRGMTLDAVNRKLYLSNAWGKLQCMNLDGSNFQPNFITGLVSPGQVVVDRVGGKLYWTEQGKLRRADLNGENIEDVVTGLGEFADLGLGVDSAGEMGVAAAPAALRTVVEQTQLLANYPNPFNPETWIPYHLANPSEVRITIYDTRGTVVRHLDLGHQREGYYTSRSRAAYWDGRNAVGERVASGVYFYQLQADNLSLLRKMLILK